MVNDRTSGKCALWGCQPSSFWWLLMASANDWRPDVVPGAQWMVTDEHPGMADRLTVPSGGAVVDGGGTVQQYSADGEWATGSVRYL